MSLTRRLLMHKTTKFPALFLAYKVAGVTSFLTPAQARAQGIPLSVLNSERAVQFEILSEALVPGAAKAGIVSFLDHQLNADPNESLLIAKYFGVDLPYLDFYDRGIKLTDELCVDSFNSTIKNINSDQIEQLIESIISDDKLTNGFPLSLFIMCLRSDAIDVVYGTPEGFKYLDIPYMEHIMPPEGWNV